MPEKINWTINVQVVNGPRYSVSQSTIVDAYDKIVVTIAAGAKDEDIEVQPGGIGQVRFILLCSSQYPAGLSYSVNDGVDEEENRIKLDQTQLLIGEGALGLLGEAPKTIHFYNSSGQDVTIEILVGRKATTSATS